MPTFDVLRTTVDRLGESMRDPAFRVPAAASAASIAGLLLLISPLHLAGAVILVLSVAVIGFARPAWGLWLVLLLFAVHPLATKVAQVNFGVTGSALVVFSAWKEVALAAVLLAGLGSIASNYRAGRRQWPRLALMDIVAGAFVVLIAVGFAVRHDALAFNQVRLLLFPVGVYIAIRLRPIDSGAYFKAAAILAVLIAVFAIVQSSTFGWSFVQTFWGTPDQPIPWTFTAQYLVGPRAAGTYGSPNELAFALMAWGFMSAALLVMKPVQNRWIVLALFAILVALALTFSRSTIVASGAGMVLVLVAIARVSPSPRRALAYLSLAIVPALILSGAIYFARGGAELIASTLSALSSNASTDTGIPFDTPSPVATTTATTATPSPVATTTATTATPSPVATTTATTATPSPVATASPSANPAVPADVSTEAHLDSLAQGWSMVESHPWGIGLGTVGSRGVPGLADKPQYILESYYLSLGVMLGWPGLVWAVLLPLVMLLTAIRALRRGDMIVGLALLSLSVSVAIVGYWLPTIMEPEMAILPWSLAAVAVASQSARPVERQNEGAVDEGLRGVETQPIRIAPCSDA
jgi:hypothetical protein